MAKLEIGLALFMFEGVLHYILDNLFVHGPPNFPGSLGNVIYVFDEGIYKHALPIIIIKIREGPSFTVILVEVSL